MRVHVHVWSLGGDEPWWPKIGLGVRKKTHSTQDRGMKMNKKGYLATLKSLNVFCLKN